MTQDPERLAEKLEERVPATEAEAAAMAAKIEDRLRKTEAARTLKPSERGPTNEEIIAEATRHLPAASDCRIFSHFVIAATKDQSWFKPEPELLEVTQADRDLWKYLLDAPKSKCSMMDTCDPATAELQAIARYRIEAFAKRDNELTEGKADQSWFKPEPEVDEATLVATEIWGLVGQGILKEDWMYRARAVIAEALAKRPRVEVPEHIKAMARYSVGQGYSMNQQKLADYILSLSQEPRS